MNPKSAMEDGSCELKETAPEYAALGITQADLEVKIESRASARASVGPKPGTPDFTTEMLAAFAEGKRQALIRRRTRG